MSVVEHTNARGLTIRVELDGRKATISDNGRGMKISPDDGEVWSQRYTDGTPTGAARRIGTSADTGTTLRVDTGGPIDAAAIRTLAARLRSGVEGLDLSVTTVA